MSSHLTSESDVKYLLNSKRKKDEKKYFRTDVQVTQHNYGGPKNTGEGARDLQEDAAGCRDISAIPTSGQRCDRENFGEEVPEIFKDCDIPSNEEAN